MKRIALILALLVLLAGQAFGVTLELYWRGDGVTNLWATAGCWRDTLNHSNVVPTLSDNVYFSAGDYDCNVDANAECKVFNMTDYTHTLTIASAKRVAITGNMTLEGNDPNPLLAGSGTLLANQTQHITSDNYTIPASLEFKFGASSSNASTWTLDDDLHIGGNLIIYSVGGNRTINSNNIYLSGNLSATFVTTASLITGTTVINIVGANPQTISVNSLVSYWGLDIVVNSTSTVKFDGNFNFGGASREATLLWTAGTYDPTSGTLNIVGEAAKILNTPIANMGAAWNAITLASGTNGGLTVIGGVQCVTLQDSLATADHVITAGLDGSITCTNLSLPNITTGSLGGTCPIKMGGGTWSMKAGATKGIYNPIEMIADQTISGTVYVGGGNSTTPATLTVTDGAFLGTGELQVLSGRHYWLINHTGFALNSLRLFAPDSFAGTEGATFANLTYNGNAGAVTAGELLSWTGFTGWDATNATIGGGGGAGNDSTFTVTLEGGRLLKANGSLGRYYRCSIAGYAAAGITNFSIDGAGTAIYKQNLTGTFSSVFDYVSRGASINLYLRGRGGTGQIDISCYDHSSVSKGPKVLCWVKRKATKIPHLSGLSAYGI